VLSESELSELAERFRTPAFPRLRNNFLTAEPFESFKFSESFDL